MSRRRTVSPSRASARVRALLLLVSGAPLLLCCAATATARRSKQPPPPTEVIELELRELGGADRTREFVVPIDGKISGSVTLFDEVRRCEVQSRPLREETFSLELRCSSPRLELGSTRVLTIDAPTILGEIELSDDQRLQVVATRR